MNLINTKGYFVSNRNQLFSGQLIMRQILLTILLLTAFLSILVKKNGRIQAALVYSTNLGGNPSEVTESTGSDIFGAANHQFPSIENPSQIKTAA
ncbi:MAG TPA: hypothetical protein PKE69_19720, partial [Pyrinomonadaceae bacterium]|nr:hypothetical protein [Pyrinomonadaceae bacterium]